ncbi:MAG: type I glutamate--ammonia ligase [Myxococcota bacterium]
MTVIAPPAVSRAALSSFTSAIDPIGNARRFIAQVRADGIAMIDLRFVDLLGAWHHVTLPTSALDEDVFTKGVAFDGSSIPGFKTVQGGDLVAIPDLATALADPFWEQPTVGLICSIAEADTHEPFAHDPRTVASRAEAFLRAQGIAEKSMWGPEFEFYIFDRITYLNDINQSQYRIDSCEADWNTGAVEGRNLGGHIPRKGGYHAMPPLDALYNLRSEMVRRIEDAGIPVRYHHHEVGGPGQCEIEIMLLPLERAVDAVMLVKYLTKMVARMADKTVTYMPKPLYNEAGSGMHFHQYLVQAGKSQFYEKGPYANLSKMARQYIGGLLKHGPALLALTNPATNSYKRLVPGFEAPVSLCYGLANRSAAVRVPKYVDTDTDKRIEFRTPDGTCNPYLAVAAQLMAGIDGILNDLDAEKLGFGPVDGNLFDLPVEERARIGKMPASLREAAQALEADHEFLLRGGVFPAEMIQNLIRLKLKDYDEVRNRPHPFEMSLYFDS